MYKRLGAIAPGHAARLLRVESLMLCVQHCLLPLPPRMIVFYVRARSRELQFVAARKLRIESMMLLRARLFAAAAAACDCLFRACMFSRVEIRRRSLVITPLPSSCVSLFVRVDDASSS